MPYSPISPPHCSMGCSTMHPASQCVPCITPNHTVHPILSMDGMGIPLGPRHYTPIPIVHPIDKMGWNILRCPFIAIVHHAIVHPVLMCYWTGWGTCMSQVLPDGVGHVSRGPWFWCGQVAMVFFLTIHQ